MTSETNRINGLGLMCVTFAMMLMVSLNAAAVEIIVGPYMNMPSPTGMVIRFETDVPASAEAGWGEAADALTWKSGSEGATYHEVVLDGLEENSFYFYRVRATDTSGGQAESETYTFQTAVTGDTPFAFAVLCDTQANPEVLSAIAGHAASHRPHFTLLGGDLVTTGKDKEHWTGHYFPNTHILNSRVPLVPALGNHEQDAQHYYDYFTLPEPEYYYRLPYGNLEIFVVDSDRPLTEGSEQHTWLDTALGNSTATWKIVCHHKPPYSSDENDYGDTLKVRPLGGDLMQRHAVPLYEKHKVDIVWNGHIHSYERTHPMLGGKPVSEGGVIYMITGGGGGGLEETGPWRMPMTARVRKGHHYCLVTVNGPSLRMDAFDLDGNLFDFVMLHK